MAAANQKSKAQSIRDYLAEHKGAKPEEVVAALEQAGIEIAVKNIYDTQAKDRAKEAKGKGKTKGKTKGRATSSLATQQSQAKRKSRPYPQRSLEESLEIARVIREVNNGNPWDTDQVAKAVGLARSNNKFFYLTAAARDYGLIKGSRDTDQIELADLGREIFFAKDEHTRKQKLIEAFFQVDLFKKVYDYYGGNNLPKQEFFSNVLQREFELAPEFHEEFGEIFKKNCKFLEIEEGLGALAPKTPRKEEDSADVQVIGEAKGKFDRTAFVIMPFVEKGANPRPEGFFREVLNSVITPAGNKAGFAVETAKQKGSDLIHTTIINKLLDADLVIADLSDHNPNVLCELGIRLATDKPVALIRAKGTDKIFDVDIVRIEDYSPNLWATTVKDDIDRLAEHIKSTWDNRDSRRPYMEVLSGKVQSAR